MTTILFSAPYMLPLFERFRLVFEHYKLEVIVAPVQERLDEAQLLSYAGQFDGALCGDDRYSARVLEACAPRVWASPSGARLTPLRCQSPIRCWAICWRSPAASPGWTAL
jgi:hypothetical protein